MLDWSPMRQKVTERFEITGRGTAVVVADRTNLPVGSPLKATIIGPDGSRLDAVAFREWLLRRTSEPVEHEAYLLQGIAKSQIPEGAYIEIEPI